MPVLIIHVPDNLPSSESRRILRTLNSKSFRIRLASTIRAVARRYPPLKNAKIRLSR